MTPGRCRVSRPSGQRRDAVRGRRARRARGRARRAAALDARPGDELILADNSGAGRPRRPGVDGRPRRRRALAGARPQRRRRRARTATGSCSSTPTAARRATCSTRTSPSRSPTTSARSPGEVRAGRRGATRSPRATAPRAASSASRRTSRTRTCRARSRRTCSSAAPRSSRSAASTRASARPRTPTSAGACSRPAGGSSCAARRGVEHRYRATLGELRRQWRGYAAGRAWLARRYEGFEPEPAVRARRRARGARVCATRRRRRRALAGAEPTPGGSSAGRYLALDALLAVEELAGFALSNRPRARRRAPAPAQVVLVADRFPARGDPLVEFARTLERRPGRGRARGPTPLDVEVARALDVDYREDDGVAARAAALAAARRSAIRCAARCDAHRPAAAASRRCPRSRPRRVRLERDARRPRARARRRSERARCARRTRSRGARRPPAHRRAQALMRVHVVDPSAFTPPYDHALCAALAAPGAEVELITSRVRLRRRPRRPTATSVRELLLPPRRRRAGSRAAAARPSCRARARHAPLPARRARGADVVHFQWLDVQWLDALAAAARARSC